MTSLWRRISRFFRPTAFIPWPPISTSKNRSSRPAEVFWKQYGNPITWVPIRRAASVRGMERLALVAARPGGQGRAMYDELDRAAQAGDADRAGRISAT